MRYSAVELFSERAAATMDGFVFEDTDVPAVLEICRRLAIKLAAARVDTFGVKGLAARLDDRFGLLAKGRRTALPRQQTLRATIDWSLELLPKVEQDVLKRLATFRGTFTTEAAVVVAIDGRITADEAIEGIANLAGKSLLTTDISSNTTHHRLLDTTRLYALEKLSQSGELDADARRHAEYQRVLFGRARVQWETQPTAVWLAEYGHRLDDLRGALDWAFSPSGDEELGVTLTVEAVPVAAVFSDERVPLARRTDAGPYRGQDSPRCAAQNEALHWAELVADVRARPAEEINAAWSKTLALAEQVGDADYQLRGIWGLFAGSINSGDFRAALELVERFRDLVTDPGRSADRPAPHRDGAAFPRRSG